MQAKRSAATAGASRKLRLSAALLLAYAVLPLALAEVGLRLFGVRVADDPYLYLGRVPSFFATETKDGERYYRIAATETYAQRNVTFRAAKPPNTFRIFCLGSSASAGWPHPQEEIYSAYLEQALRTTFPDRPIEVINASAHAYAAYRTRLIFEEVIDYEPDLIIVYEGNNEFLEKRVYRDGAGRLASLRPVLNRFVSYRMVRGSWLGRRLFPDDTLWGEHRDHVTYAEWSKIEQLALRLRSDPVQLAHVKEHYARSVESIVRSAGERHVPVILLTSPVNLRDWHPNVSYQPLSGESSTHWQTEFYAGRAALLRDEPEAAVRALRAAAAISSLHAETAYYLARALERTGDYAGALEQYSRARDLDYNPFRAISDFNASLREIAQHHANARLTDADAACRSASAPRTGFDLFLDYVHPNQRGNLVIAQAVYDTDRPRAVDRPALRPHRVHAHARAARSGPAAVRGPPRLPDAGHHPAALAHDAPGRTCARAGARALRDAGRARRAAAARRDARAVGPRAVPGSRRGRSPPRARRRRRPGRRCATPRTAPCLLPRELLGLRGIPAALCGRESRVLNPIARRTTSTPLAMAQMRS